MSILITGGAGFIVSNLAKTLVSNNYEVIVYDNFWRNDIDLVFKDSSELYQKLKIIKGDILDIKLLKKNNI
jgi:UDP-glucose 4-epimerase